MQNTDSETPLPTIVTLTNRYGIVITLTNIGASWMSCTLPLASGRRDVVLGSPNMTKQMEQEVYMGATVGRVANRIDKAKFSIGSENYAVSNNEGIHCLHGGKNNFSHRIWNILHLNQQQVVFSLVSPDGDQGFPGELWVEVSYELTDKNKIVIRYRYQTTKICPVNLTNHTYFNLAGEDKGESMLDHELEIHSCFYLPTNKDGIPTGEWRDVANTTFDFRHAKKIRRDFLQDEDQKTMRGYDHTFILNDLKTNRREPVAILRSPNGDVKMNILTTMPSMQLYTGNNLTSVEGKSQVYMPYSGVAFETQFPPNSVNHPEWGVPFSPISQAGQIYTSETCYQFIF
ncbi:TPA: galactose-1-epimerase [Providencia rettgeri]